MADPQTFEDQASLYVMGELPEAERREFERRLAQSSELRDVVRQLEEGMSALAMTAPRRQPPREVWTGIEKAVSRRTKQQASAPSLWMARWRHGWAAAVGCLACALLYAVWERNTHTPGVAPGAGISEAAAHSGGTNNDLTTAENKTAPHRNPIEAELVLHLLQTRTQEVTALSRQVAELTRKLADLSQDLSNRNVQLSEPGRLKFFQLNPGSASVANEVPSPAAAGAPAAPISTNLQRALFFAMAREMGWMPETFKGAGDGNSRPGVNNVSASTTTNLAGVDFVDLKPSNNQAASAPSVPSTPATESSGTLNASFTNAIPGFVSGTNAVLAFDPAVFPSGSTLSFFTVRSWGNYGSIGTAALGSNPTVVTVPLDAATRQGGNVTVILSTSGGAYSVIGQFPASSVEPH